MVNKKKEDISIKGLWESFLHMNGIKSGTIPAIQKHEMRKTFYMACGMLHTQIRDEMSKFEPELAIFVMETQMVDIADYLGGIAERDQSSKGLTISKPEIIH